MGYGTGGQRYNRNEKGNLGPPNYRKHTRCRCSLTIRETVVKVNSVEDLTIHNRIVDFLRANLDDPELKALHDDLVNLAHQMLTKQPVSASEKERCAGAVIGLAVALDLSTPKDRYEVNMLLSGVLARISIMM